MEKPKHNFLLTNLSKLKGHSKERAKSLQNLKKERSRDHINKIKEKLEIQEEVKEKKRMVKETANKFKKLISAYEVLLGLMKKHYKVEQENSQKINKHLTGFLVGVLFAKKANINYHVNLS